jgi:hypothetical protein
MLLPHFVPCQQDLIDVDVRFVACSMSVRAYPTALACKVSTRRCAALRRPTCFELLCTCRFDECGGISQCVLLHSVCNSRKASPRAAVVARALSPDCQAQPRPGRRPQATVAAAQGRPGGHSWSALAASRRGVRHSLVTGGLLRPTLASPVAPSIPPTAHKLPSIHARAAFAARASLDWPHRLPCVTR